MQEVKQILHNSNSNNSNRFNKLNTIAIVSDEQIDYTLDQYKALYPENYRGWHAKFIKKYGLELWERCAKIARADGKNPERYLVWLLKQKARELVSPSLGAR